MTTSSPFAHLTRRLRKFARAARRELIRGLCEGLGAYSTVEASPRTLARANQLRAEAAAIRRNVAIIRALKAAGYTRDDVLALRNRRMSRGQSATQ